MRLEPRALIDLIEKLKNKKSAKRRSAAKTFRKLGDIAAGPYLLDALENELKDVRTWETQYQMIMAIGECGYRVALPFVKKLMTRKFEATMVYMAIGDAVVRLSLENKNDASPAISLFDSGNDMLIDGGLRAIAMLRMVPSDKQISHIISFVSENDPAHLGNFWVIAAAPGWSGGIIDTYLEQCMKSTCDEFRDAAELAQKNVYKKWQPL